MRMRLLSGEVGKGAKSSRSSEYESSTGRGEGRKLKSENLKEREPEQRSNGSERTRSSRGRVWTAHPLRALSRPLSVSTYL